MSKSMVGRQGWASLYNGTCQPHVRWACMYAPPKSTRAGGSESMERADIVGNHMRPGSSDNY